LGSFGWWSVISEKWFLVFSLKLAAATNFYREPGKNNRTDKTDVTKAENSDWEVLAMDKKGEWQYGYIWKYYCNILVEPGCAKI
jgi:hypothetical protein